MSLATTITNLETRRDAIAAELATFTSSTTGPDFSIDGVSISDVEHRTALLTELAEINRLLELYAGPCVVYSQGR